MSRPELRGILRLPILGLVIAPGSQDAPEDREAVATFLKASLDESWSTNVALYWDASRRGLTARETSEYIGQSSAPGVAGEPAAKVTNTMGEWQP